MRALIIAMLLLVSCSEMSAEDCHKKISLILDHMGESLAQVEGAQDFPKYQDSLESDHLALVHILEKLQKIKAPLRKEEPLELVQIKERLEEQLQRVLQMEDGAEWIESLQNSALDELDRIDPIFTDQERAL